MRDFLVLCQSQPPSAALEFAAGLVPAHGALTALYVHEPMPVIAETVFPAAAATLLAWSEEALRGARAHRATFEQWARDRGLGESRWIVAQGPLPDTVALAASWHDVVVAHGADPGLASAPAEVGRMLVASRAPWLWMPAAATTATSFPVVAIAWNQSAEAMRAIRAALPWLAQARRVVVFEGQPRRAFDAMLEPPQLDLDHWLKRHGVSADFARLQGDEPDPGAQLLAQASDAGASLLVMGGYGRSRLSEFVLGGVTRHVLAHATLPVLLHH